MSFLNLRLPCPAKSVNDSSIPKDPLSDIELSKRKKKTVLKIGLNFEFQLNFSCCLSVRHCQNLALYCP